MVTYPSDWEEHNVDDCALEDLVIGGTRVDGFDGEWKKGTIGDILTILHGKSQHLVESSGGKYPILGTGGVIGKATRYLCDWECVLIGRKGTIDNPIYMNIPFWTIDTLYYSKPKSNQCVKFQYYLFSSINWLDYAESSGRPSLAKKVIKEIVIRIPSLSEQQAIASVLSDFDEHINNLTKLIEKKKAIRDGAIEELISGKTRANGCKGEWQEATIDNITKTIITGGTPSTLIDEYWGGDIPWLSSTEIHQKTITKATKNITDNGLNNSSAKIAPENSVLIALAGQGKTRGTAGFLVFPMALNQSLAALVPSEETDSKFLFYLIESMYQELRELSSGDGGRGGLNKKLLRSITVNMPKEKMEQEAIGQIITEMDEEIEALEIEKAKIEGIKEGAMNDLLTGRVRLKI